MGTRLLTLDRNRFTRSGGIAPLDMMLHLISCDHGRGNESTFALLAALNLLPSMAP
jgi:transcriptional regulator GlxA family with amidase domain